mmetsp:Transcript_107436/g.283278  ORF Transcript_107436/g.283278 Transcript_107436/m.283278 type:complete len:219 (+) Transcript_107436:26-682(+)
MVECLLVLRCVRCELPAGRPHVGDIHVRGPRGCHRMRSGRLADHSRAYMLGQLGLPYRLRPVVVRGHVPHRSSGRTPVGDQGARLFPRHPGRPADVEPRERGGRSPGAAGSRPVRQRLGRGRNQHQNAFSHRACCWPCVAPSFVLRAVQERSPEHCKHEHGAFVADPRGFRFCVPSVQHGSWCDRSHRGGEAVLQDLVDVWSMGIDIDVAGSSGSSAI